MKNLTLAEWNKSPALQQGLKEFLDSTTGVALMQVLQSNRPQFIRGTPIEPHQAQIEFGHQNGYHACIDTILSMQFEIKPQGQSPIEATYGTEEQQ